MIRAICKRLGIATKFDLNEYARRFRSGDDLPTDGDGAITTPESAMRISAVYACVRILSQTIASLPLDIYEKAADGQQAAADHPLAALLRRRPNRYQTAFDWMEQQVACLCLRGNAVSLKVYEGVRVVQLIPVHPARVHLEEYPDALIYRITDRFGKQFPVLSEDVLHHRWLTTDGYWGSSPIAEARDAVNLARKVQKYGISVFDSGGAKRVLLKFQNTLGDTAYKRIKEDWKRLGQNAAETAILEEGGDATTIGMNADEAQYLETRQMTVADVARLYTMPLVLLGVHEKTSSYASTEQFDIMFEKHTIRPPVKKLEARLDVDLIGNERYFCKFNMDALLRGDINTRTMALSRQFERGAITIDEWRAMENRNPVGGEVGQTHFIPANLLPADRAIHPPEPQPAAAPPSDGVGGSDNAPKSFLEPVARDIASRLVRSWRRGPATFRDFEEYRASQRQYAFRSLVPLFAAGGMADAEDAAEKIATQLADRIEPGVEFDVAAKEQEICALLMSVVTPEVVESAAWLVESVKARRIQEES